MIASSLISFGEVPAGAVLPIPFASYGATNRESITLTGLAVTDIEVYKGVSMTQRASDAGYALMDTDGIDIDGITGIHGFSIDTGDDTDAGFYTVGSFFTVVVSAVTIDGQAVNLIAATFRLRAADGATGYPSVSIGHVQIGVNGLMHYGTAQSVTAIGLVMDSAASFPDNILIGGTVLIKTGDFKGARGIITDITGASDELEIAAGWSGGVEPTGTPDFDIFASAQGATLAEIAAAILDLEDGIEPGVTLRESQRLQNSAAAAKLSGAGTGTVRLRDLADTKDRIVATTTEAGDRLTVTRDVS